MPIVVDKERRRAEVEAVAFDLVAERGIEAVTTREVAAACDCSTSIVSHYFANKNELLFNVYQLANRRARERLMAAVVAQAPLFDCFAEILPTSADARRNWQVWIAFWARAHLSPEYLEERRRAAEESLALYRDIIAPRYAVPVDADLLTFRARCLIAAVAGIALEAVFAPDDWTVPRMREVLEAQFLAIGLPEAA
ncbi:TetR family transcriptional regulator [Croceicoccus ponticola]|uniref:TetR family transcriptional regulator n=1 Tax=Croceicoccus ponticola TaxID=2217664 RepID=A0A437H1L2_9SPHN|nr:TetR/AcrR family transcriptional regulator [Croceicoccus ponticola]RVQ69510.1 TetR family transcriptional regulator [Croceicoccus ponticola]